MYINEFNDMITLLRIAANNYIIILQPPPLHDSYQKKIDTLNALLVFLGNKH